MLGTHFREELPEPVAREFDLLYATLRAKFYREHHEDGTHRDTDASVMTHTNGLQIKSGPFTLDDRTAPDTNVAAIRPPDLATGTYHDYAPPGLHTAVMLELETTGDVTLTGIAASTVLHKRFLYLRNRDSTANLILPHESTGSKEQNRFNNPASVTFYVGPRQTVLLYYDPERKRWAPVTGGIAVAGTYTPTLDNQTNVASSSPAEHQWIRVMDVITVSGAITVDPDVDNTLTKMGISLPFPTTFTDPAQCAGAGASHTATVDAMPVLGDPTSFDQAYLEWTTHNSGAHDIYYTFTYRDL